LYGLSVVMSSLTSFVWKRSVGVIGRKLLIGIASSFALAALYYYSAILGSLLPVSS
jgi:Mg/Co/Ni transporter MgtE